MKNKIKYIGVIGGNGAVGGLIVNYLLSELSDQHILISYRTRESSYVNIFYRKNKILPFRL